MTPKNTINNSTYVLLGDSELGSNRPLCSFAGSVSGSNESNLGFREPAHPVGLSASERLSPLADFVGHVVRVRSKKKMSWADALPIIAPMKNLHIERNRSVPEFPRNAMRPLRFPADAKASVSSAKACGQPIPTLPAPVNLAPKSRFNIHKEIIS